MNDTLASLIVSPKLKSDDNRACVVSGYEPNKAASILSSVNMPSDTAASILSAGDTYFNADTRLIILFDNQDKFGTTNLNSILLSVYYTNSDTLNIAGKLLDLDTTVILYPIQSAVYNDTNYFLLSWENIKGAIGCWEIEFATDAAFTTDYDTIIIDVNTPATANTTTYYKQLASKKWYMRARPFNVKKD